MVRITCKATANTARTAVIRATCFAFCFHDNLPLNTLVCTALLPNRFRAICRNRDDGRLTTALLSPARWRELVPDEEEAPLYIAAHKFISSLRFGGLPAKSGVARSRAMVRGGMAGIHRPINNALLEPRDLRVRPAGLLANHGQRHLLLTGDLHHQPACVDCGCERARDGRL
ncbi:hypothetical protein EJ03DRAFT_82497 [Teratosphaeria nubilosa]|uniref:Uncharacterized protein n=1 Tax=Teratosphaeria nubilosa TaxID=161662 RepID=A0A6G1LBE8_9PEZI|nr:hypothetical protein EJ03DRAFT_82497 [Teratosphaeria nubilosa]